MTKKRFLAVYDYGSGAVWVSLLARSPREVETRFRDLRVLETQPDWMSDDELADIEDKKTFDIDDIKATDWVARLLREPLKNPGE